MRTIFDARCHAILFGLDRVIWLGLSSSLSRLSNRPYTALEMSRVQKARKRTTVARNALFVEARRAIPVVTTPSNAIKRGRKLTSTEQILKDETFERRIERALLQREQHLHLYASN